MLLPTMWASGSTRCAVKFLDVWETSFQTSPFFLSVGFLGKFLLSGPLFHGEIEGYSAPVSLQNIFILSGCSSTAVAGGPGG